MDRDIARDMVRLEAEFTRVWAAWERAIEQLSRTVPAGQVRALLIVDDRGVLPVSQLAKALGISLSGAARLCSRMEAAGLLACELDANDGGGIMVVATEAGQRLAGWVRDRRRAVLARELGTMSAEARQALVRGLRELARRLAMSRRDTTPPEAPV